MLRISKLTDYAIILMVYIGKNSEKTHQANELANTTNLASPTVAKLLKILTKAQLLTSTRGAAGGYKLGRDISDISIADIINTIEGPIGLTQCSVQEQLCEIANLCNLKQPWMQINNIILKTMQSYKLKQLINETSISPKTNINLKTSIGNDCNEQR